MIDRLKELIQDRIKIYEEIGQPDCPQAQEAQAILRELEKLGAPVDPDPRSTTSNLFVVTDGDDD